MRIQKRQIAIAVSLIFAGALCAVGVFLYSASTEHSIQQRAAQFEAEHADLNEKIRQAQQAAIEKEARRQVAARVIAERAASGDSSTDGIDARQCAATHTHSTPTALDVVVNKKHCMQPLAYEPTDLVTVQGATLRAEASQAFARLLSAASQAGQPLTVTSSYRSYTDQVTTYGYWVSVSGQDVADTYSARPGYSEHQTGLAVDLAAPGCVLDCFGSTTQYQWLQTNAATYGFIQRYYKGSEDITGYKAEEWHFRYVGVPTAQRMKAQGIMTLEQLFDVPGGLY